MLLLPNHVLGMIYAYPESIRKDDMGISRKVMTLKHILEPCWLCSIIRFESIAFMIVVLHEWNVSHLFRFWCEYWYLDQLCCKDHGDIHPPIHHRPTTPASKFNFRKALSSVNSSHCLPCIIGYLLLISGNNFLVSCQISLHFNHICLIDGWG